MAIKILKDIRYVHAGAQDSKPGAIPPAMYEVGDTVIVEFNFGERIEVKLTKNEASLEGQVTVSRREDVVVGEIVSFDRP